MRLQMRKWNVFLQGVQNHSGGKWQRAHGLTGSSDLYSTCLICSTTAQRQWVSHLLWWLGIVQYSLLPLPSLVMRWITATLHVATAPVDMSFQEALKSHAPCYLYLQQFLFSALHQRDLFSLQLVLSLPLAPWLYSSPKETASSCRRGSMEAGLQPLQQVLWAFQPLYSVCLKFAPRV